MQRQTVILIRIATFVLGAFFILTGLIIVDHHQLYLQEAIWRRLFIDFTTVAIIAPAVLGCAWALFPDPND